MKNLKSAFILSIFLLPKFLIAGNLVDLKQNMDSLVPPTTSIELFVNEPWLSFIRDGKKTVEGRAGPLNDYSSWVGKKVRFYSLKQDVFVHVIEVHHYDNLHEFLNVEGWKNAAPHLGSFDDTVNAYLKFYPGDFIEKAGGMNGIIVSMQPPIL